MAAFATGDRRRREGAATSFQRKGPDGGSGRLAVLPGTRPSVRHGQLLLSSGVPSLDFVLGGGVAVGTVFVIEEDVYGVYSNLLFKHFLAEGVVCGHNLFVASDKADPAEIVKDLPSPLLNASPSLMEEEEAARAAKSKQDSQESMRIAWRYQNVPKLEVTNTAFSKFGRYFDLSRTMAPELIQNIRWNGFSLFEEADFCPDMKSCDTPCGYTRLLNSIQKVIYQQGYDGSVPQKKERNILRIGIQSLGSVLWGDDICCTENPKNISRLTKFLYALRGLLRTSLSACMITIPAHLIQNKAIMARVSNLSDTVVGLESFIGSERETNPLYKDYHGLIHIHQIPRLNSLICDVPDSKDLAFRLKRKLFVIEAFSYTTVCLMENLAGNLPAVAVAAVLKPSEGLPEGSQTVCGYDFDRGLDYHALLQSYLTTGFQATSFGQAVNEINRMIEAKLTPLCEDAGDHTDLNPCPRRLTGCTIFLGFTSNLISSGVRETIRYLVQHNMVDVLVTTAGGVEEDLIKCLAPTYIGDFSLRGKELRQNGINRIGNLLVPNDNYCKFEDWLMPILDQMVTEQDTEGVKWTPSKLIARLGKEINNPESVYYWAQKNSIPVLSPALTDGSLGDMIFFHSYKKPGLVLDIVEDLRLINTQAIFARKTGMIILGGGLVKHHIANANLMRNGADFSVYINTAQEFDGSDSGARPDEAVSWGKIRMDAKPVKVYADASLVFPLLVAQTFAQRPNAFVPEKQND